ncbi:hypothetical protein NMY22_g9828 [Coprinellus aureogranulatus]|nr:hypothetical protein NMY22_g9828 [Coprinellus aureogranulatus]
MNGQGFTYKVSAFECRSIHHPHRSPHQPERPAQIERTMDAETAQGIVDRIPVFEMWKVVSYVYMSTFMTLVYFYVTTIDEEVRCIWPQPRWKLGKVLFLTTRYSALVIMAGNIAFNIPHYGKIGIPGCTAFLIITQATVTVYGISILATLWLFLYALLECKPKYFPIVISTLLAYTVSKEVLDGMYIYSQKCEILSDGIIEQFRLKHSLSAVPLEPLDVVLGYPCAFTLPARRYVHLTVGGSCLSLAYVLVTTMVGLVTLFMRYRKQRNGLLAVIRREGGFYLISSLILKVLVAAAQTPHSKLQDSYQVLYGLWLLGNIFALRMLLLLRKIEDPGTRAVVSSIAFQTTPEEKDDESSELELHAATGGNHKENGSTSVLVIEEEPGEKTTHNPTSLA